MESFKIKKNLIHSEGQQFSNYIYTFGIERILNVVTSKELLPYQIQTNNAYLAYLNSSPDMLKIFKQALILEENYYTVMNMCVMYLVQRDLKELDELQNKACRLADGKTHHMIFAAEMNLIIKDYDQAILKLVELFDEPEQSEAVAALFKQIFKNILYSKQHLSTLIQDDNIIQKLYTINKRFFSNEGDQQFQPFISNLGQITQSNNEMNIEGMNFSKLQSQLMKAASQQSATKKLIYTLRQGKEKSEQLPLITGQQEIIKPKANNQIGPSIDFTFIDIIIDNPKLFSFQLRIPYMIGSHNIRDMNKLEQKIAEGGIGAVYVSKNLINNEIHAVKVIKEQEDQDVNLILQEIIIQDQIQQLNPNLFLNLRPLIYLKKQNKLVDIYIPLELAQFSLYDYIKEIQVEQEEYIQFYNLFIDFIVTLHENNFAHRDIKPQNILYIKDVGWKLADFGESIKYKKVEDLYNIRGTPSFLPQEIRKQQKLQNEIRQNLLYNDLYAVVCTLVQIKQPNLTSKGLTDFMDSGQFESKQHLLLQKFNDLNMLKQLRVNQENKVPTKIILKKQIQEQQTTWECLERFQFCLDQQIPLDNDLILKLDEMLGLYQQRQQHQQLSLYSILISSSFPFQIERFNHIVSLNFKRHELAMIVVSENYFYYRTIVRYLTIIKLYKTSIFICDAILKISYEAMAHLLKIEALRLSGRIYESKQELDLAYRYLLQVQSYTLDEQILFVELYQKLHNEVPKIKVDQHLVSHMKKINNKVQVESSYHDPADGSLIPPNLNKIHENKHLQIRLDVLLKSISSFSTSSQFQNIILEFGTQFLVNDQLTNIEQLIELIKQNLVFWNTLYHQKIHIIGIGLSQLFTYYGKYQVAYQIGLYFHKILKNFGSWINIICHFEDFMETQFMLNFVFNKHIQPMLDIDALLSEISDLSLFDNVYLRLRICNYFHSIINNFSFNCIQPNLVSSFQQDLNFYTLEGLNILQIYLNLQNVAQTQKNMIKIYLENMLRNLLSSPPNLKTLRIIKKIYNIKFFQNENNIYFKNLSIVWLNIGKQHIVVSQLLKKAIQAQMQVNPTNLKQHKFYYSTLSKIHESSIRILNHQKMLGWQWKQSLFVSQDDQFNTDIKYHLWSQLQFKQNKIAKKIERRVDSINLFQSFINQ